MELQQAVGQVVYKLRHKSGISQMELAERAGLHLNTVQALEAGRYQVKLLTLFLISRAIGVSVCSLVREVEAKRPKLPEEK